MPKRIVTPVFFVLLLIFIPTYVLAQGRIFEGGESGITAAFDFHGYADNNNWEADGSTWVAVTYKGLVDFGLGSGVAPEVDLGTFLLANVVLLDHNEKRGFGLQLGSRYARETWDVSRYDELYTQIRDLYLETNLKVFRRLVSKPKTRVVLGLAGLYRFNQHQLKAPDGEVLFGRDYGEWGAAVDLETMNFGWLFLRGRLEYAEENWWTDDWRFVATVSMGLSISFGGGREAIDAP